MSGTAASAPAVPASGEILAEKYKVARVMDTGGMGIVVEATHIQLGGRVALKFLIPEMITEETKVRFAREAQAAASIKSAYVCRVSDYGTLSSGAPYLVMEYLEGQNLSQLLRNQGPLPHRQAVEYLIQAADAVAEAHTLGIVHRDIKPANLFLAEQRASQPVIKVLDFGISKIASQGSGALAHAQTRPSDWLGSPLYSSPEQIRSAKDVDHRADIWALGVTLYELLCGRVPFDRDNMPDLFAAIVNEAAPSLDQMVRGLPPGMNAVVQRCLAKEPERRFQSVGEMVLALVPFAPQRARSIAERAVSLTEAAGLMTTGPRRRPLDSSLPEPVTSPMHRSGNNAGKGNTLTMESPVLAQEPVPPTVAFPAPSAAVAQPAEPASPSEPPAPKANSSFAPPPESFPEAEGDNLGKVVGMVAGGLIAAGLVLYFVLVAPSRSSESTESQSGESARQSQVVAPTSDAASTASAAASASAAAGPTEGDDDDDDPEDVEPDPTSDPADEPKVGPPSKPPPKAPPPAKKPPPKKPPPAKKPPPPTSEKPPPAPAPTEPAPPPPSGPGDPAPAKPTLVTNKCYKDGDNGEKVEVPCPW